MHVHTTKWPSVPNHKSKQKRALESSRFESNSHNIPWKFCELLKNHFKIPYFWGYLKCVGLGYLQAWISEKPANRSSWRPFLVISALPRKYFSNFPCYPTLVIIGWGVIMSDIQVLRKNLCYGAGSSPAGRSGARPPHLKSVPPHFTFAPRLLHTSNTVFFKFGPPSGFWPPLLLNPGHGPAMVLSSMAENENNKKSR